MIVEFKEMIKYTLVIQKKIRKESNYAQEKVYMKLFQKI